MNIRIPITMIFAGLLSLTGCQTGVTYRNSTADDGSPFPECTLDMDCARLEQCFANTCYKAIGACDTDTDCSYGEECIGSTCSQKLNNGCTWDFECTSGTCNFGSCL